MTRHHRTRFADGSDLVVDPKAAKELADLLADLDTLGGPAPAAPAVEPEIEDQEDDEDDIDAWLASLGAQVTAPAVMEPEVTQAQVEESQASAAPAVTAPVVTPSPAPTTSKKSKKSKTPKTVTSKPDRTDLAAQVGDAIKAAGPKGIRSDTLEQSVCRSASQRVGDLRKAGWIITSEPVTGSEVVRYVFQGMTAPKPVPVSGVRLYTYGDGSVESRSFVGVTDLDESAQLADHLAACAAAWIAARAQGQVQP